MTLNFYIKNLNLPDDVREYDHVDLYVESDSLLFECSCKGDPCPCRVFRVYFNSDNFLKGVSFDG